VRQHAQTKASHCVRKRTDVQRLPAYVRLQAEGGCTASSRVLAARWVGMAVGDGRRFALDPASISTLGYEYDDPDRPVIALWNAAPGARGGVHAARSVRC
jgi:hypothetical protein